MESQGEFGFKELFTHIIRDMAMAVCERFGESKQQQFVRTKVAAQMILGLKPRDVVEAMLAGQSVMMHAVLMDSVHDILQGQVDVMRRGTRSNIVALNKAMHMNVDKLEHYHTRPSQGIRESTVEAQKSAAQAAAATAEHAPPVPEQGQTHAGPARAPSTETPTQSPTEPSSPPARIVLQASPEAIAACRANPEAMAALEAGDAERFAHAMGIAQPSEAYLTAAAGLRVGTSVNDKPVGDQPRQSTTDRPGGIIR